MARLVPARRSRNWETTEERGRSVIRANEDGRSAAAAAAAVDVERPAVEGQLPHLLLDDVRRVSGSASSAGEGINDSIVDE